MHPLNIRRIIIVFIEINMMSNPSPCSFVRVMRKIKCIGEMVGKYSDWTPLADRAMLFAEDLDTTDPWQFKNFRVS